MTARKKPIYLAIPSPCHEDWNAMAPKGNGRYCASCMKTVTDLRQMGRDEIYQLLSRPDAPECITAYDEQLHKMYYPVRQPGLGARLRPVLLAAAMISLSAGGQGRSRHIVPEKDHAIAARGMNITQPGPDMATKKDSSDYWHITGKVTRKSGGAPLQNVSVLIKGNTYSAVTDQYGRYSIPVPKSLCANGKLEITFRTSGYFAARFHLSVKGDLEKDAEMWRKDVDLNIYSGNSYTTGRCSHEIKFPFF